jgi:hypothetical protein
VAVSKRLPTNRIRWGWAWIGASSAPGQDLANGMRIAACNQTAHECERSERLRGVAGSSFATALFLRDQVRSHPDSSRYLPHRPPRLWLPADLREDASYRCNSSSTSWCALKATCLRRTSSGSTLECSSGTLDVRRWALRSPVEVTQLYALR